MSNCPATYRYFLDTGGDPTEVYPITDDGLEKIISKGEGEEYYRETLDGEFSFVREDYDLIVAATIEDEFSLIIYEPDSDGNLNTYFQGYFTKTDCKFEVDECGDGVCTVALTPNDRYDDILGGMDKEFDLVELEPEKTGFNFYRQPIYQVYGLGDRVLTCYLGGTYFELSVPTPIFDINDLFSTYYFGYIGSHVVVYGETLDPDISGEYIYEQSLDDVVSTPSYIRKGDGDYRMIVNAGLGWDVVDISTGAIMYKTADNSPLFGPPIVAQVSGDIAYARGRDMFLRFITNENTIYGGTTFDIPASDIVASNPSGYNKVSGIGLLPSDVVAGTAYEDVIIAFAGHSTTPTRYGKWGDGADYFEGEYFTAPTGLGLGGIYPQGQSSWSSNLGSSIPYGSFWFQYIPELRDFQDDRAELIQIADAFKLSDALSTILAQLSSEVTHQEDSSYSSFLYSSDTALRPALRYPIITPKSNIVVGEYDQPAKKGPVKLADILQLLWVVYRCKWHIDTSGKFIVEHISYYENGGTYSGTITGADLTTLTDPQTGKAWSHGANRWEYEKETMPERIEPGWMDRTTRPFDGYPIVIRSIYVQKGNIESQKAGRFTSDIDYIQLQPEDIAKEGFAVVECEESKGVYSVPYVEITLPDSTEFKLQNGYLAFIYLHPNYHRYGLPATLITMNEEDTTALSVTRRKIQEIDYPEIELSEPIELIVTNLGTGKLIELRENVHGRYVTAKIAHNTE